MVNEEAIKHSYSQFQGTGYADSYEDFKELLSTNNEAVEHAYSLFTETGYVDSIDDFKTLMGLSAPIQEEVVEEVKKKDSTELPSEDGSLESGDSEPQITEPEVTPTLAPSKPTFTGTNGDKVDLWVQDTSNPSKWVNKFDEDDVATFSNSNLSYWGQDDKSEKYWEDEAGVLYNINGEVVNYYNDPRTDDKSPNPDSAQFQANVKQQEERELKSQAEATEAEDKEDKKAAERSELLTSDEFQADLSTINTQLMGKEDEVKLDELRKTFDKYGIDVALDSGSRTSTIVLSADGVETVIDTNSLFGLGDDEEATKARQFVEDHAKVVKQVEIENFEEQALAVEQSRSGGRLNSDGTKSSVNLTTYEEDGVYKVVPTLFPIDPNIQSTRPDRWYDLAGNMEEAKELAAERGELYTFDSKEEAERFANGGWETADTSDARRKQVYEEAGFDYSAHAEEDEKYRASRDLMQLIGAQHHDKFDGRGLGVSLDEAISYRGGQLVLGGQVPEHVLKHYPQFFIEGGARWATNVEDQISGLQQDNDLLIDRVFDNPELEAAREKADMVMQQEFDKKRGKAISVKQSSMKMIDDANNLAMELFEGKTLEELTDYTPADEVEAQNMQLVQDMVIQANIDSNLASRHYENAHSYYDKKFNEAMATEVTEGWEGTKAAWSNGWNQGKAAESVLLLSMNLMADDTDLEDAAYDVAERLSSDRKAESVHMARYQAAVGNREIFKAIDTPEDFLQWSVDLASSSLSMMMPYGSWIVGGSVTTGAAVGSAIPGYGTLAGGAKGLELGMGATSFAMEYTNAVLDVAGDMGYDMQDPEQVLAAFQDDEVWSKGRERGIKRGVPIAVMDMIGARVAGRVFKGGQTASTMGRIAKGGAERLVVDPLFEGAGEMAAMISAGDEVDMKEVYAEMGGAIGSKTPNMGLNILQDVRGTKIEDLASNLADPTKFRESGESARSVMSWTDRQEKLGKITPEQAQDIRNNVGNQRTVQTKMKESGMTLAIGTDVESRLLELEAASNDTKMDAQTKKSVLQEISDIYSTGKLSENPVELAEKVEAEVETKEETAEDFTDERTEIQIEEEAKADRERRQPAVEETTEEIVEETATEVAEETTEEITEETTEETELDVFESLIGLEEQGVQEETTTEATEETRFSTESAKIEETPGADVDRLTEQMNQMPEVEMQFEEVRPDTDVEVNPIEDSGITDEEAKSAGFSSKEEMVSKVEEWTGIPMFPAMSDILASGNVLNSLGQKMRVDGGLLFNSRGVNKTLAWAGVNKDGAQTQVNRAVSIYENNKALFENLWSEGKLPNGHVPMVITRMGDAAVNSNEAVFRWAMPLIKSFSAEAQTKSFDSYMDMVKSKQQVTSKATKDQANKLAEFVEENNITSLGQFVETIVANASKLENDNESLTLPVRALAFDLLFGAGDTSSRQFVQDLTGEKSNSMFTKKAVYNALGDKTMMKTSQGQVVGLVGVDVLNPRVERASHSNYAWGPAGKLITLFSNPKHGLNAFPTWRVKSNRMHKVSKAGTTPSAEANAQQVGGAFFADGAFVGDSMTSTDTVVDKIVAKIRFAFPNVTVTTSKVEFAAAMADPRVKKRLSKSGEVIYGLTMDGRIVLNPDAATANTAIHEFGHIWTDYLRSSKKGREILARGFQLVKGTDIHKKMIEQYGDTELALEEAVVELLASKGEAIVKASMKSKFKSWMNAMFKFIKENFTKSADIPMENIKDMTLDQFIETGLADMFSGSPLKSGFNPAANEQAAEARFSKEEIGGRKLTIDEIIQMAQKAEVSNATLRAVLINRGFKAADIDAAIENNMRINLIDAAPAEFGNIQEGSESGRQMFAEIMQKVEAEMRKMKKRKGGLNPEKVRRFALETLKADPRFKAQFQTIQDSLIVALDKRLESRRGVDINREINSIKNKIKAMKATAKDIKAVQLKLAAVIKTALPVSQGFTTAQIQKIVKAVINANTRDQLLTSVDKVMDIVEQQRSKMANTKRRAIIKSIKKMSKPKKVSGKVKSTGVNAETQAFLSTALDIIIKSMKGDIAAIEAIKDEVGAKADEINAILEKESRGVKLTTKEANLVDKAMAVEMFENFGDMSLEDVTALEQLTDNIVAEGRQAIKVKRAARQESKTKLTDEANEQIGDTHSNLFNEAGEVRDANERAAFRQQIWNRIKEVGIFGKLGELRKHFLGSKSLSTVGWITHLGTISNALDSGSKNKFFTKNIYAALNKMISNHKKGVFAAEQRMDNIAKASGFDSYEAFSKKMRGTIKLNLPKMGDVNISYSQGLRIIALSMNDVQRAKLDGMGIDEKTLEAIKKAVGTNAVEVAERTVEFLSNEYFDSVNDVYSYVNDTNLGHVDNYFPTKTLGEQQGKLIEDGDFAGVFNAETAPALKERTNSTGDIDLLDTDGFFGTLDNHFEQMEKFKAFAHGVKKIATVMNIPSVKALLEETKTLQLVREKINLVVNQNAGRKPQGMRSKFFDAFLGGFVGYTLSNKLAQIPKQMSSFIAGFQNYKYVKRTGNENIFQSVGYEAIDMAAYVVESAGTYAKLKENFILAMEISPVFRERVMKAMKGEFTQLETGRSTTDMTLQEMGIDSAKMNDVFTKIRAVAGATTTIGDILGVLGYMTTYKRNLKMGMSKEEALQLFEDYNATQQTQRETEKTGLQQNSNFIIKAVVAFTSSPQLYFNNILQSTLNIRKAIANGEKPSVEDVRKFYLNLGAVQLAFYSTAHLAQFVKGDDDDREEVTKGALKAASGLMLLESLPFVGALVEQATADEPWKGKMTVNPLSRYKRTLEDLNKEETRVGRTFLKGLEIISGINLDPVTEGLLEIDSGEDEAIYEILGVSKSYRPGYYSGKDKGSSAPKKGKKGKKSKTAKKAKR